MTGNSANKTAYSGSAVTKLWKHVPDGVRGAAHRGFQHLVAATTAPQVLLNWRKGSPAQAPISIAGFFGTASGVGEAARLFANALEGEGISVVRLDVSRALGYREASPLRSDEAFHNGVLVSFLNPPELLRWLPRGGAHVLRNKRHIGYWFWELPEAPPGWKKAFRYVDEVWCQSGFTAEAFRALAPKGLPTMVLPHPIFTYGSGVGDRNSFKLPSEACVVLAIADLRSTAARKNPLGALEAFLKASPSPDPNRAVLICKVRGEEADPTIAKTLLQAASERPDVTVLRGDFSGEQMRRLVASADVAISLHRAEGFGLLVAEAMWLGKPVVTTGWSGVLDFATPTSAVLVDFTLVPVRDPQGIYSGGIWAEPDIEDASRKLKALIDDRNLRDEIGRRARVGALAAFDRLEWLNTAKNALGLNR